MNRRKICIIGAGAKAAALVARAAVLGNRAPEITVVECKQIGAGWDGTSGYSNGDVLLCTPPEKDVGFPYMRQRSADGTIQDDVEAEIARHFSWTSFMIATSGYGDWVDRGRPFVSHATWARYLRWVFERAGNSPVFGEVVNVSRMATNWEVRFKTEQGLNTIVVDGVVLTGPGKPKTLDVCGGQPPGRLMDSLTFFRHTEALRSEARNKSFVVVGAGGSAGTIVGWLVAALAGGAFRLSSLSTRGTLFLRGDGFSERRHFTDPSAWPTLSLEDRQEILSRTEEGVISAQNRAVIDQCDKLEFLRGKAHAVKWDDDEFGVEFSVDGERKVFRADYVVSALGFDLPGYLLDLLGTGAKVSSQDLREQISPDLSLREDFCGPGLHVPGLADLAQGPGFATLGCLGLMARRVIDPYVRP